MLLVNTACPVYGEYAFPGLRIPDMEVESEGSLQG